MTLGRRWLEGAVSRVTGHRTDARCPWCLACGACLLTCPTRNLPYPPDSNDDALEQLRKVTTGGGT